MCKNFLSTFPLAYCFALDRSLLGPELSKLDRFSDHSPIILRAHCDDFGPPHFKLHNSWMLKDDFDVIIKKVCSEFVGYGTPDMFLLNKLKQLKMAIRCWKPDK